MTCEKFGMARITGQCAAKQVAAARPRAMPQPVLWVSAHHSVHVRIILQRFEPVNGGA